MAAIFPLHLFLAFLLTSLLLSPVYSLKCTSQTFSGNTQFENCADLPVLNSFLHYSYESTNSTLSIAFIAPPPKPDGWIAWAINPTATGMLGSQALLAYKDSNGSVLVKTYNISSYQGIVESSKLSIDVLNKRAEFINGSMTIFATIALPKSTTIINQVWQVGPSVINGVPVKHQFQPANLGAKEVLDLVKASVASPAQSQSPSPASSPAPTEGGSSDKKNGGGRCSYDLLILVAVFITFSLFWGPFY